MSKFLTIDVSSELATICEAQLRGTWQVPAELLRLALRLGADEVSVRRRGRGFEISWSGPTIESENLANLQSALDAGLDADDRQYAIAAIESSQKEGLLWAAGLRGARLRVVISDGVHRWTFVHSRRRGPSLDRVPDAGARRGVEIRWRCGGLDRRRALKWLAIAARYAPARVVVDGIRSPTGFAGGLYHLRLEEPVPCLLGLTRRGDEPTLWLLRDGVVSTRATVPGYPPFEVAVELGGLVAPGASAADMRRAVAPFLGELVDRVVWMMVKVSDRLKEMNGRDRERLSLLLLHAARKGLRTREISRIPLVPNAAADRFLSIDQIGALSERRGGLLAVISPGEDPDKNLVDPQSTLVASSEARDLLTAMTAARFQAPSRRARRPVKRVTDRMWVFSDHVRRRLRGARPRREVPSDELRPQEKIVFAALETALSPLEVSICEGGGAVGRASRRLVVPRSNPALAAAAKLIATDASWLYPLLLALDTGQEPSNDLRGRWLDAVGGNTGVN